MRRSIATALTGTCLIVLAAGCQVGARQKQAAARILTSTILNSVYVIESKGHQPGRSGDSGTEKRPAAETAAENAPAETVRVARQTAAPRCVDATTTGADETPAPESPSMSSTAEEQPLPGSAQTISTRTVEVVASRLAPPSAPAEPVVHERSGDGMQNGTVDDARAVACLRNPATRKGIEAALRKAAAPGVICQLAAAGHILLHEVMTPARECRTSAL